MATTRQLLLGWIEHWEREHPGKGTHIPTWLCSMDAVEEAVRDGDVVRIGGQPLGPRLGTMLIYGLTDKGRLAFYAMLPKTGADPNKHLCAELSP